MVNNKYNYYGTPGFNEIDLRKEFTNTLRGKSPEIAKGKSIFVRIFRRNSSGRRIECSCLHPITREPPKDRKCNSCLGEGYQWDEHLTLAHSQALAPPAALARRETLREAGIINTPTRAFYLEPIPNLTNEDKLIVLRMDIEGNLINPVERLEIYKIVSLEELRLDNGRLEFYKVAGYSELINHESVYGR